MIGKVGIPENEVPVNATQPNPHHYSIRIESVYHLRHAMLDVSGGKKKEGSMDIHYKASMDRILSNTSCSIC